MEVMQTLVENANNSGASGRSRPPLRVMDMFILTAGNLKNDASLLAGEARKFLQ